MVDAEVAEDTALNLNLLGVGFPLDLVAGLKFSFAEYSGLLEESYARLGEVAVEDEGSGGLAVEPASCRFGLPLVAVSVSVEDDGLDVVDVFAYYLQNGCFLLFAFADEGVNPCLEVFKCLCHSSVEGEHSARAVGLGTYGTELETVAGECEWRGTVAVGVVYQQFRNRREVELHCVLAGDEQGIGVGIGDVVEKFGDCLSEEGGDDCRGRFVRAEAVGVGGAHNACLKQSVVVVHSLEGFDYEGHKAKVVHSSLAGRVEKDSGVG